MQPRIDMEKIIGELEISPDDKAKLFNLLKKKKEKKYVCTVLRFPNPRSNMDQS